jgi:hypothetical protein
MTLLHKSNFLGLFVITTNRKVEQLRSNKLDKPSIGGPDRKKTNDHRHLVAKDILRDEFVATKQIPIQQ